MPRLVNPTPQFLDDAGDPVVSGKLFVFESGTDTPKTTYKDINLSIQNTHPIVLTADGRTPNTFFDGSARVKLTDSDDVQIWDKDPVGGENIGGNFEAWNPLVIYSFNDIVEGSDGNFYISFTNGNVGNDPVSSPAFWEQSAFIRVWNTNVTYAIGDTVKASDNNFYVGLTASNQGNNPVSSPTNWGPPFTAVGTVNSGDAITVDNTDPLNPVVDLDIEKEATVTAATGDLIAVADVSDTNAIKKVTAQTIANLAPQGDVVGPAGATDGAVAVYDGVTGKLLKDGVILGTVATLNTGISNGNVPLIGTKSATLSLAGLVEQSTSAENIAGIDDTVFPSVAGTKEMIDTHVIGGLVQRVNTRDGEVATGTSTIALDDSIPQITEGTQFLSQAITPTNASNKLVITVVAYITSTAVNDLSGYLFQDSTADAIAVCTVQNQGSNSPNPFVISYTMTAGTTSATTFTFRAGQKNAGTMTFNGTSSARKYGGAFASQISIEEISV